MRSTEEKPGLSSVHKGREARKQGRYNRPTVSILLYALMGVAAVLGVYRFVWGRQVESSREALLAKARAAKVTIGTEWTPLRDRLEAVTLAASGPFEGDFTAEGARNWDFRHMSGLYLRIRQVQATSPRELREAALYSVKDAFTGCFLRPPTRSAEQIADAGPFAEQPWNLKQAYQTTRVLTPEWENEVREAQDDMRLRVFEEQYDRAQRTELPLLIDIVKRADFYLLALDEDADEAKVHTDGGAVTETALQLVKHPVRIFVYDTKTMKLMFRVRRSVEAGFTMVRNQLPVDPETQAAMQRQVNNCALAQEVTKFVEGK